MSEGGDVIDLEERAQERAAKVMRAIGDPSRERANHHTDVGNGMRFALMHKATFRFVVDQVNWIHWNGRSWAKATTGELHRAAKEVVADMLSRAILIADTNERSRALSWAMKSEAMSRIEAMITAASSELDLEVSSEDLDKSPYLLTVENGTIDLVSGTLLPHNAEDLITKYVPIPYDRDAYAIRWRRFLSEVFNANDELIEFISRAAGYSLTGDTREEVFFLLHGKGCNGKSKFVSTIQALLGDSAVDTPMSSLLDDRSNGKGPSNDLARLRGARFVSAAESDEGARLSESTVKKLTGNDKISARFLYGEYFEFRPIFKLWFSTNHRPRISGGDDGIWRRVKLIPFDVSFLGREDRTLEAALRAELPGVLAWAVEGCLRWQAEGLGSAGAVDAATDAYRQDSDRLAAFIDDALVIGTTCKIPSGRLFELYKAWCEKAHEEPLKSVTFYRKIAERPGVEKDRSKVGRWYVGIGERTGDHETPDRSGNGDRS